MKVIQCTYISVILSAICIFLVGCDQENFRYLVSQNKINVDKKEVNLDGALDAKTDITITSDCDWILTQESNSTSWLSLSDLQGTSGTQKVTITNKKENIFDSESATLTLSMRNNSSIRQCITVYKSRAKSNIVVDKESLLFDYDGGEDIIKVQCSDNWTFDSPSTDSWIHLTKVSADSYNHEIKVNVDPNTGLEREYTITLKDNDLGSEVKIKVVQKANPPRIELAEGSKDFQLFEETGGSATIYVNTNLKSSDITLDVNSTLTQWCYVQYKHEDKQINIEVRDNYTTEEREGIITLKHNNVDSVKLQITVKQKAGTLVQLSTPRSIEITNHTIAVESGFETVQEITRAAFYLHESESELRNGKYLLYKEVYLNSETLNNKILSATFEGLDGGKTYYIWSLGKNAIGNNYSEIASIKTLNSNIALSGDDLENGNEVNFGRYSSYKSVNVTADADWNATVIEGAEWCSISTWSNISINVTENTSSETRIGKVDVKTIDGSASAIIIVKQSGAAIPNPDDNIPPTVETK